MLVVRLHRGPQASPALLLRPAASGALCLQAWGALLGTHRDILRVLLQEALCGRLISGRTARLIAKHFGVDR